MTITLYELAGENPELKFSPHCWKSRLALAHKGLDVERVAVSFTEKDKIEFSKQGLVPVLRDNDTVVSDSWAIACYLEEQYPDHPSLFGGEEGKALAESINRWGDTELAPFIRPIVLMEIFNVIDEKAKDYFRQDREKKLGMTLETYAGTRDDSIIKLREALSSVRETLSRQDYIGGSTATYADLCLLGMFMWIRCVSDCAFLEEGDIVKHWYEKMLAQYDGLGRDAVTYAS